MSIRDMRLRADMSQAELAEKIGVTQHTVSDWEAGKIHPRVGRLMGLSKILDCSVEELVEGE